LSQRFGESQPDAAGPADHNRGFVRQIKKRMAH
jgi:hypothetical protein